jgi:hypothetical protein
MILAGLDEAGYGPLLGPLAVGCSAFGVPSTPTYDDGDRALPCLWTRLGRVISRRRDRSARKLHVADSKTVYSPSSGLAELERSVLAFSSLIRADSINTPDALLSLLAPESLADLSLHPWYNASGQRIPLACDPAGARIASNVLSREMGAAGVQLVHLSATAVPEIRLNRLLQRTRNKASVLFTVVATHIQTLLEQYSARGLHVTCDRQGGREHYAPLLRLMFEDWSLEVLREEPGCSDYRLTKGSRSARLTFREGAESASMPVALASMVAKYLRELLMDRFNRFWSVQRPGLRPTAGYYTDGQRFLRDTAEIRAKMGIPDDDLIRSR